MQQLFRLLMIVLLAASCGDGDKKKVTVTTTQQQPPVMVDVILAGYQPLSNTIEANGTVVANETTELRPEVSGRLTYLNIPEGRAVGKGTVLARINDADLQAQLRKLRSQLVLAQKTEERFRKLLEVEGINRADYDVALNQVNTLKADINVVQADISRTVVRAPFSGTIGLRNVSPGAYVTPQTVLATIQQVNRSKIDFTLPEIYAGVVTKGRTVVVEVSPTEKRRATILAVEPQASTATRNLTVRAIIDNGVLNPGTFVKVLIEAGSKAQTIMVPSSAIIPDAKSKKVIVAKNGKGIMTTVETGLRTASGVEITSGLNIGDSVVVTGVLYVRPASVVKVRSVKKLEEIL
ncbi:MAG: efflux transporter periplasmic adaptor subunit [Chitinophagaceae bacterium]|jgi:membrane fusion protein (multidrug efflux system)|nr:efflux transporter periplasmic adaptor subunit [Chitinophagaceae bacterium]